MKLFLVLVLSFFCSTQLLSQDKWYVPSEEDALKYMGQPGTAVVEKDIVNILIWNAHKEGFDSPWQNEFNELRKGMDFVLLQESLTKVSFFLTDLIFPSVYKDYAGVVGFSFYYLGKFNGNVNLSYYSAIEARVLHSPDKEPVVNTVKPTLVTRYQLANGKVLTLANIFLCWLRKNSYVGME